MLKNMRGPQFFWLPCVEVQMTDVFTSALSPNIPLVP
jgi:hypothetical protein